MDYCWGERMLNPLIKIEKESSNVLGIYDVFHNRIIGKVKNCPDQLIEAFDSKRYPDINYKGIFVDLEMYASLKYLYKNLLDNMGEYGFDYTYLVWGVFNNLSKWHIKVLEEGDVDKFLNSKRSKNMKLTVFNKKTSIEEFNFGDVVLIEKISTKQIGPARKYFYIEELQSDINSPNELCIKLDKPSELSPTASILLDILTNNLIGFSPYWGNGIVFKD